MPPPPQSGIGNDPRPKFEELNWTREEREGHQVSVENIRKGSSNVGAEEEEEEPRRRVNELKDFQTNKERSESPQTTPSAASKSGAKVKVNEVGVGEMASQCFNMIELGCKKNEPSIKSPAESDEKGGGRLSLHEMGSFWANEERNEDSQVVPSMVSDQPKSLISERVKVFEESAPVPARANSLNKEDRRPPLLERTSDGVKAFQDTTNENEMDNSLPENDRIPPLSAPSAERVKTFGDLPKEAKEVAANKEGTARASAAIDERIKGFQEGTLEPQYARKPNEKALDEATDTSIAAQLSALGKMTTPGREISGQALSEHRGSNEEHPPKNVLIDGNISPLEERSKKQLEEGNSLPAFAVDIAAASRPVSQSISDRLDPSKEKSLNQLHEGGRALKELQEKTKETAQQSIDELASEIPRVGAVETESEPDAAEPLRDPDTKESPALIHSTKNRARPPAKKQTF